jgi:hypothetical protein
MWEEPQCIYVGMHMMTLETSGKTSRSIFYNLSCGKKFFATSAIFSDFSVDSAQCSKKCSAFCLASYIFGYSVQSSCITPGSSEQC